MTYQAMLNAGDFDGALVKLQACDDDDGENTSLLLAVASEACDALLSDLSPSNEMAVTFIAKCINRVRWLLDPEYP